MRDRVRDVGESYVSELEGFHPDVEAVLLEPQSSTADASVRITCGARQQVRIVMETAARLTSKYFLDEGIYIQASADFAGKPFS